MERLINTHASVIKQMVEEGLMKETKGINIEVLNLQEFKFKINGDGIVNMAEFIKVKDFIDNSIASISNVCRLLTLYHKDSPHYWGELKDKSEEFNAYEVSIDLENFMEEDSESKEIVPGFSITDNYVLAEKVIKKFEESGNDTKGIEDFSCREKASWYVKDKKTANKLVSFIEKNYVSPKLKELEDFYNIEDVIFLEDRMDFKFKDKKSEKAQLCFIRNSQIIHFIFNGRINKRDS